MLKHCKNCQRKFGRLDTLKRHYRICKVSMSGGGPEILNLEHAINTASVVITVDNYGINRSITYRTCDKGEVYDRNKPVARSKPRLKNKRRPDSAAEEDFLHAVETVRDKYQQAKHTRLEQEMQNNERFKSITQCIDEHKQIEMPTVMPKKTWVEEQTESYPAKRSKLLDDTMVRRYETNGWGLEYLESNDGSTSDSDYGVHRYSGKWYIGDTEVRFLTDDDIEIGEHRVPANRGVYELLFRKQPKFYTNEDLETYKKLLELTNMNLNDSPTYEYKMKHGERYDILANLFGWDEVKSSKEVLKNRYSYRSACYDDPNELVDRLRLLHTSQKTGSNSCREEITSLIQELRDRGYIA